MVETDGSDVAELAEVVLVGHIYVAVLSISASNDERAKELTVSVPRHDVERRVLLRARPESSHELVDDLPARLVDLERRDRVLKIAGYEEECD